MHKAEVSEKRYAIYLPGPTGRFHKVGGLVYSSRKSARLAVARIRKASVLFKRTAPELRVRVLR